MVRQPNNMQPQLSVRNIYLECIQILRMFLKPPLLCLQRVGALMVTAPPQSGKTSLLQLLDKAALKSNLFADIYYVNIAENNNSLKHGLDQYKKSWETLFEAEAAGVPTPAHPR